MTGHEHEFAVCSSLGVPVEIVVRCHRLVVLVHPEERHIDIIAGEGEVVGVTAEECDLHLGRHYQSYVGVLLVTIEPVLASLVHRYDICLKAGCFFCFFADLGRYGFAGIKCLLRRHLRLECCLHTGSDVLHRHQHVQLKIGAFHLFLLRTRIEAVRNIVFLLRGHLLQLPACNMMVRKDETFRTDKRAGAAIVETDTGEPDLIQPLLCRFESVMVFQEFAWRIVEGPHPVICPRGRDANDRNKRKKPHYTPVRIPTHGNLPVKFYKMERTDSGVPENPGN